MSIPIIIDTDAGSDDIMAIAYLLSRRDVRIEAITVVHGLAHVAAGARNLRRLLCVAGQESVPVFEGEEEALRGSREFPPQWRDLTDTLPGVRLPEANAPLPEIGAVEYLRERFQRSSGPVRILALGPLTNLALALRGVSNPHAVIDEIVTMGGAIDVPGNLRDGNSGPGLNETAEWNIYCDPDAAAEVFDCDVPQLLVPLDATNQVPIDTPFVAQFQSLDLTPIGQVIADLLRTFSPVIATGRFYAWDPLAAVALLDPTVVQTRSVRLKVVREGHDVGRTVPAVWDDKSPVKVALQADAARFNAAFTAVFRHNAGSKLGIV